MNIKNLISCSPRNAGRLKNNGHQLNGP